MVVQLNVHQTMLGSSVPSHLASDLCPCPVEKRSNRYPLVSLVSKIIEGGDKLYSHVVNVLIPLAICASVYSKRILTFAG